jgi:hypothetical protein
MSEIQLFDNENGEPIGEITQQQLDFLIDQLEEEALDDRDYFINRPTLDMLEEEHGDSQLIELLREAMGDRDEMEVRWEEV